MMKKIATLAMLTMATISLAACGNNSNKKSAQERENSSLKAENSSLKAKKKAQDKSSSASSSSNSNQNQAAKASSSSEAVIKTPQDAAALVTHAMSVDPDIYHARPINGGFLVSRDDMPDQDAVVHYDGSITWSNGDTQSYDSAAATTYNGGPSTLHPSN